MHVSNRAASSANTSFPIPVPGAAIRLAPPLSPTISVCIPGNVWGGGLSRGPDVVADVVDPGPEPYLSDHFM